MSIKRTLNPGNYDRLLNDFKFLKNLIESSLGTLDLAIRDNYLNLYYRGNSLAKIQFNKNGSYEISAHKDFFTGKIRTDPRFNLPKNLPETNITVSIDPELLHPFFQKTYLDRMFSSIKKKGISEELVFEHMLITDNLERSDFLIIDRQITDSKLGGKRMDLLALRQNGTNSNKYHFVVLEVKMGNNPELKSDVAAQLDMYVNHIRQHFAAYKKCYEEQYRQKKGYGLFTNPGFSNIEIEGEVEGIVIVCGYSIQAAGAIAQLRAEKRGIRVQAFSNLIQR